MSSAARSKHALLIGINEYPNLSSFAQLEGCVNDVQLMAGLLKEGFGFPEEHVTVMTDAQATRDGILQALDALADRVGTDDIVVVHYAGHGSQITDLEGDEPDGLDETIVPYDAVRQSGPNTDITDDEVHAWILRITEKTPYLTLLFDCCHSGTITRDDDFGVQTRALEPDLRPAEELQRTPFMAATTRSAAHPEGPSGWLPLSKRYVLIAGCRDEERASEYHDIESDTKHGALTFFLGRALTDAVPGTTYRDVYERIRPHVTAHSPKQHPQMEGALDRELFGVHDIEPMQFVAVEEREGQGVTLAAGAAHGLTVDSEWTVYPAGTKKVEEDTPVLGRVRITEVGAVTSEAEVMEESEPNAIAVGTRAVEAKHGWSDAGLRVQISAPDGEAKQALVEQLEQSPLTQVAGIPADVRAYLLPARSEVTDNDPVPQLGPLAESVWAFIGMDLRLVMPAHAASKPNVAALLRDNLEKIARYRHALALDNPDPHSALRGTIAFSLKRKDAAGTWIDAEPEEAGGEIVFEEGERLAFTITNNHTEPVFINVLDFGLSYAVQHLTISGAQEELLPGKTLQVGVREGGIPLKFPDTFPFVQEPGDDAPVEGTETIKVFATTKPTDFSAMNQQSVRSLGGPRSSLDALLRRTFQGTPMRDLDMGGVEDEADDWTTFSRTFVLRRKTSGASLGTDGARVELGGITIRARGLEGQARVLPSPTFSARTRSVEHVTDDLDVVLDREHVGTRQTVEIQEVRTRSLSAEEPEIEIEVPSVDGQGQFMLYTDEAGVTTWQFAEPQTATRSLDGTGTQRFVIRRAEPVPPAGMATRGIIGAVGSKLIKLLVFPIIDPIIGKVGDYYAERWEGVNRPYGLRPFTPDDFQTPQTPALGSNDWRRLGEGRSLLFVHGTFSRAYSAFGGLSADTLAELHRRYEGRVFAFDHFTLSHDPKANIEWFFEHVPDAAGLDVDIVCHSRGGLVSRMLAEKQSAFSLGSRSLDVGKVVFVASPNAGTHLADPEHMGDLVDSYTNLLNFIPDNPVTDILDGVITVAKQLAVGALRGLEGLQSMRPGGEFQQWLNSADGQRGDTTYFALGADFTPSEPGFKKWAMERLTQSIFGADNDLVVPTASVYDTNGSGYFPIEERHVFDAAKGISHTTFFQDRAAQEKMLEWLQA